MSSVELGHKVTLLSDFNVDGVLKELSVNPRDKLKVAAINYFFRTLEEGIGGQGPRTDRSRMVKTITVDQIGCRLELLDSHKKSFFKNKEYDYPSLLLAILLDTTLADLHIPDKDEDDFDPDRDIIENIPNRFLQKAYEIFDSATDLASIYKNPDEISPESLFLAHINWIDDLDDFIVDFDDMGEEELRKMHRDLPRMKAVTNSDTELGRVLLKFISQVEDLLPDFDSTRLLADLKVQDETAEAKSVKFIFNEIRGFFPELDVVEQYQAAKLATLTKAEYRLALIQRYEKDFFGGSSFERDCVILAALADTYLGEDSDDIEDKISQIPGFNAETSCTARLFVEQVNELLSAGECTSCQEEYESRFLAHVHAASELYHCIEKADALGLEKLKKARDDFSTIDKFIFPDSAIGQKILSLLSDLDEEITAKLPMADILPFTAFRGAEALTP